jgi:hypothetical protein
MGGISRILATSFITLMLVHPNCRCPRSRTGITAAFLYCGGYLLHRINSVLNWGLEVGLEYLMICSTRFMFAGVNWKGIFGLFSALSRCCVHSARQSHPLGKEVYDKDCITAPLRGGVEWPDVPALWFGQLPEGQGEQPPSKQRCHRGWLDQPSWFAVGLIVSHAADKGVSATFDCAS